MPLRAAVPPRKDRAGAHAGTGFCNRRPLECTVVSAGVGAASTKALFLPPGINLALIPGEERTDHRSLGSPVSLLLLAVPRAVLS